MVILQHGQVYLVDSHFYDILRQRGTILDLYLNCLALLGK